MAVAALLGATAVWGATFATVKGALSTVDAMTFLFLRFALGAAVAAGLAMTQPRPRNWALSFRPALLLGVFLFGGFALQTKGLESTSPTRSAFITGLTVLIVPFVTWAMTRTRPSVRAFLAPIVALAGLQQLTGVKWNEALPVGDVLTVGSALLYAVHIVLTSRVGRGLAPMPVTAVQLGVVAVLALAFRPLTDTQFTPSPMLWWAVAYTGIAASALAIGIQVWAQKHLSAVRAAVIYALEPVFALLWVVVGGFGVPQAHELRGGALILVAVLVSEVGFSHRLRISNRA
jgi:drug/metabolite transporter (DMT)-like permease